MNTIHGFLEVTAPLFLTITGLLIWLTHLEAALLQPRPEKTRQRRYRVARHARISNTAAVADRGASVPAEQA